MSGEEIYLGQLVKAVGVKGEIKLLPSRDFWLEVLNSKQLSLRIFRENGVDSRPAEILKWRPQKGCYVLKMPDLTDRNAAESLVGAELFISAENIDVSLPEQALPFQIIGKRVVDEGGQLLGRVTSVLTNPVHDIYEVTGEKGSFLVPAVPEFILSMDAAEEQMVIRPIPGLITE